MGFFVAQRNNASKTWLVVHWLALVIFCVQVILPPAVSAQPPASSFSLPFAGEMITPTPAFVPALLTGVRVDPNNPFEFRFLIDTGDAKLDPTARDDQTIQLVKYFLATLTVPETDLWVNLSPYEHDRIIPEQFGYTEMGRDLLAQDYLLKQLTASLVYPEGKIGEDFWARVYAKAAERFGTTDIPTNTFNKVWIVPDTAVVFERNGSAVVLESRLKVMLEEDYVALQHNRGNAAYGLSAEGDPVGQTEAVSALASSVIRDIVIPEIEREVNEGATFSLLRQIYRSMILATWYKQTLRQTILGNMYIDKNKTGGITSDDPDVKEKIYAQYLEAFKTGVYNYIREDYDPATQQIIPRKYFSGGVNVFDLSHRLMLAEINKIDAIHFADSLAELWQLGDQTVREDLRKRFEYFDPMQQAFIRARIADIASGNAQFEVLVNLLKSTDRAMLTVGTPEENIAARIDAIASLRESGALVQRGEVPRSIDGATASDLAKLPGAINEVISEERLLGLDFARKSELLKRLIRDNFGVNQKRVLDVHVVSAAIDRVRKDRTPGALVGNIALYPVSADGVSDLTTVSDALSLVSARKADAVIMMNSDQEGTFAAVQQPRALRDRILSDVLSDSRFAGTLAMTSLATQITDMWDAWERPHKKNEPTIMKVRENNSPAMMDFMAVLWLAKANPNATFTYVVNATRAHEDRTRALLEEAKVQGLVANIEIAVVEATKTMHPVDLLEGVLTGALDGYVHDAVRAVVRDDVVARFMAQTRVADGHAQTAFVQGRAQEAFVRYESLLRSIKKVPQGRIPDAVIVPISQYIEGQRDRARTAVMVQRAKVTYIEGKKFIADLRKELRAAGSGSLEDIAAQMPRATGVSDVEAWARALAYQIDSDRTAAAKKYIGLNDDGYLRELVGFVSEGVRDLARQAHMPTMVETYQALKNSVVTKERLQVAYEKIFADSRRDGALKGYVVPTEENFKKQASIAAYSSAVLGEARRLVNTKSLSRNAFSVGQKDPAMLADAEARLDSNSFLTLTSGLGLSSYIDPQVLGIKAQALSAAVRAGRDKKHVVILAHNDIDGVASAKFMERLAATHVPGAEIAILYLANAPASMDAYLAEKNIDRAEALLVAVDLFWSTISSDVDIALDHHGLKGEERDQYQQLRDSGRGFYFNSGMENDFFADGTGRAGKDIPCSALVAIMADYILREAGTPLVDDANGSLRHLLNAGIVGDFGAEKNGRWDVGQEYAFARKLADIVSGVDDGVSLAGQLTFSSQETAALATYAQAIDERIQAYGENYQVGGIERDDLILAYPPAVTSVSGVVVTDAVVSLPQVLNVPFFLKVFMQDRELAKDDRAARKIFGVLEKGAVDLRTGTYELSVSLRYDGTKDIDLDAAVRSLRNDAVGLVSPGIRVTRVNGGGHKNAARLRLIVERSEGDLTDEQLRAAEADLARKAVEVILAQEDARLGVTPLVSREEEKELVGVTNDFTKGGIDLSPYLLNLQVRRDGQGAALPIDQQPFVAEEIDGLVPVIITVTPLQSTIPAILRALSN